METTDGQMEIEDRFFPQRSELLLYEGRVWMYPDPCESIITEPLLHVAARSNTFNANATAYGKIP